VYDYVYLSMIYVYYSMKGYNLYKGVEISREMIKSIANSLAEEMARKMYYKLLMLKFLPEIKAVEKGKLKALKGKEINNFLVRLIESK
jgi:hypothetical protein